MWRRAVAGSAVLFLGGPALMLDWPTMQARLLGEYQNKIRKFSPPQKVFETFASGKDEGLYMTLSDLLVALTPFNYCEDASPPAEEALAQTCPGLMRLADVNRDGKISVYEYYNLLLFLGASESSLLSFLPQGQLSAENLAGLWSKLRQQSKMRLCDSRIMESRKVAVNESQYQKTAGATAHCLQEGGPVTRESLLELRRQVFRELLNYQFTVFPKDQQNRISGQSLAKSLLFYMDQSQIEAVRRNLEQMPLEGVTFTRDEYCKIHYFLEESVDSITRLAAKGYLTKDQLRGLSKTQGYRVSDSALSLVFDVLDTSRNGVLDAAEIIEVISRRMARRTLTQSSFPGGLMLKQLDRIKRKCIRLWQVLLQ